MLKATNILLIILDSLRADHIGLQVNGRSLTPALDRFIQRSVYFTQAIAQGPSTPPSVKALMSSAYPLEYDGVTSRLTAGRPVMPGYLRQAGYTTAAVTTNEYLSSRRGWGQNFSFYDDCNLGQVYKRALVFRLLNQVMKRIGRHLEWPTNLPAEIILDKGLRWLSQAQNPSFLWLHLMDVHWPYIPQRFTVNPSWQRQQRYQMKHVRSRFLADPPLLSPQEHLELQTGYRAAIMAVDKRLGNFFSQLEQRHILDNTAVFILADHGEEFGEHGGYFHSSRLYDVLLRVPLIIYLPPSFNPVKRSYPEQVRLIDVLPTMLELAGAPLPPGLRGASLLPVLQGKPDVCERISFTEAPSKFDYAVRWNGWKYLFNLQTGKKELYHLEVDPGENNSCLAENPSVAANMHARLDEHIRSTFDTRLPESQIGDDAEMVERLRRLGYVD